ncbi:hypothetical protein B879_02486 [Cecembia lonarensis LW9]|uniref:DUF4143 domain-containing protein n=1 Tax=Cecembia lonarensis (strain CCUG 58316 / KCTC 22772 / LW9) TaxID=1225176 RepID=K1LEW9_CECL9|nr:hypothetical protein B879_02486 [Cecembia lonarensis LW9]
MALKSKINMYFFDYDRRITYFWRTTNSLELDWLEERGAVLHAFETKWNPKRRALLPASFGRLIPAQSSRYSARITIRIFFCE